MEEILKFFPFLRKFYQFDLLQTKSDNLKNWREKAKFMLKFIFFGLTILNLVLYIIVSIIDLCVSDMPIDSLSLSILFIITYIRMLIKYLIIVIRFGRIQNVMDQLPATYSAEDDQNFNILKRIRNCRKPTIFLICLAIVTLLDKNVTEVRKLYLMIEFEFIKNCEILRIFYDFWPFLCETWNFLLVLFLDNLIFGIIVILTVEFEKLKKEISNINDKINLPTKKMQKMSSNVSKSETKPNFIELKNKIRLSVIEIIVRHSQLLDIRDELEKIFALPFLVELMGSALQLCSEEMLALTLNDTWNQIGSAVSAIIEIFKIFVLCHYAQKLKDVSLSISDAIYESNWEAIEDIKVKNFLLMILMRSQKSKTLTCWKFSEISYELFGVVSLNIKKYKIKGCATIYDGWVKDVIRGVTG